MNIYTKPTPSDNTADVGKNQLKHTENKKKNRYIVIAILSLTAVILLIVLSFLIGRSYSSPVAGDNASLTVTSVKYIGNSNSMKFHKKSCSHLPDKENQVYYNSREAAVRDGMDPCKICNP